MSIDLDSEPAVRALIQWLQRGALKAERPGAEQIEAVLATAYRLQDERDQLESELLAAGLETHYAEHPHLRPSDEDVARAVIEQTTDLHQRIEQLETLLRQHGVQIAP